MVLLVTSDNEQFTVDREVVERSVLIRNVLEVVGESDEPIPLSNASSTVLRKVLEYCEHHRDEPLPAPGADQDRTRRDTTSSSEWDQKFMAVDREMIMKIITTANYLQLQSLLDLGSQTVANMMKGKTPQEIRKLFNIVNDFTPEGEVCPLQQILLTPLSTCYLHLSVDAAITSRGSLRYMGFA
ncbi:E3 ubiquitin ligase SCF complex Skp subunit [Marasmius fiardii PR-910]|nr:E3 ubiquitin ligase SCF complex Skp subunit [Marasmius fiardii PR-910]